jgi:hypothetical protein
MPTCLTQAQHDEAVKACSYQTVKGIGALPTGDPCKLKDLPICPTPVRWSPTTTTATDLPPPPGPDTKTEDEGEPNYALWGGLALLLVAAGGYVVYKATR